MPNIGALLRILSIQWLSLLFAGYNIFWRTSHRCVLILRITLLWNDGLLGKQWVEYFTMKLSLLFELCGRCSCGVDIFGTVATLFNH